MTGTSESNKAKGVQSPPHQIGSFHKRNWTYMTRLVCFRMKGIGKIS